MQRADSLEKTPMMRKLMVGEKGTTEDEMVGWHHRLIGYEFEHTLGVGNGQRSMVGYSPWGHKESDMTEQFSLSFF